MNMDNKRISPWCAAKTLVLGCGNILFGDDGFGPAVAGYLNNNYRIPDGVLIEDAGTGIREMLFDISLSEIYPSTLVIVDCMDKGRKPGEYFEIELTDVPKEKIDNFTMHNAPTANLLRTIQEEKKDIKVSILVCQSKLIPDEMQMELSDEVNAAVPKMAQLIYDRFISTAQ